MRASTYAIIIGIIVSILEIYLFSSNELHSTLALVLFLGSIVTIPLALYFKKRSFTTLTTTYAQLTAVCTVLCVFSAGLLYSYMAAISMSAASNCIFPTVVYYLFSFVAGFVRIFSPQGTGFFEIVYSELATFELTPTPLIIFVTGFRVLVMLCDMLTWIGYMQIKISGGVGGKQDAQ
jgi:hypothetical protein